MPSRYLDFARLFLDFILALWSFACPWLDFARPFSRIGLLNPFDSEKLPKCRILKQTLRFRKTIGFTDCAPVPS